MTEIKVWFSDFWPGFKIYDNLFLDIIRLAGKTPIITSDAPELLFYSVFGNEYCSFNNVIKIWFTGENHGLPNFSECDYALSGYYIDDDRHYRLPLYVDYVRQHIENHYIESYDLSKRVLLNRPKQKFCNFLFSNGWEKFEGVVLRKEMFRQLSIYKHVDAGGKSMNTLGYLVPDKMHFISDYKFTIAFENSNNSAGVYGYITEKILDPLVVGSIPLYWGNPLASNDFNSESFISFHEYGSIEKMVARVIEIDNNDALYQKMRIAPIIQDFENSPLNLQLTANFFRLKILCNI